MVEVLTSDWLTQGPAVEAFEAALCEVTGARFAVAVVERHRCAPRRLRRGRARAPGDVVATSPLTFSASAACALYVGATPTLVDIDPATLDLGPTWCPPTSMRLVAVHYAGLPVDLAALAHRPRVVIEDAAHALGAITPDGPVGYCARSRHVLLLVPPGEAHHHRRGRRGDHQRPGAGRPAAPLPPPRHRARARRSTPGRTSLDELGLQLPPHRHPGGARDSASCVASAEFLAARDAQAADLPRRAGRPVVAPAGGAAGLAPRAPPLRRPGPDRQPPRRLRGDARGRHRGPGPLRAPPPPRRLRRPGPEPARGSPPPRRSTPGSCHFPSTPASPLPTRTG